MRAVVLYNPSAGNGRVSADNILTALRAAGLVGTVVSTKDDAFPEALAAPADVVVAAGGDGTVRRLVRHLPDRDIPIAILPLGGANNVARSLGIVGPWERLPRGWKRARKRRLDVGMAHGPWGRQLFLEGIGIGPIARAIEACSNNVSPAEKIRRGRKALQKLLRKEKPNRIIVTLDGKELTDEVLMVEALNTRYTGPSLKLAPDANPGDGYLDILCVGPRDRDAMLRWLDTPHRPLPRGLRVQRGRKLKLAWKERPPLHLDDELPKLAKRGRAASVTLERDPLTVLAPRERET